MSRFAKWGLHGVSLAALLVIWQWYGTQPKAFAVAPPTKVFPELWHTVISGELLSAVSGTLLTMSIAYLISALAGVGLGILIALSTWAQDTLGPIVDALFSAPLVMLVPFIGIYFGTDIWGRVVLIVMLTVWTIMINTMAGIHQTPPQFLEMSAAFGAGKFRQLTTIILPSALPYIATGLRLGLGRAFRTAIFAELVLAITNFGRYLNDATASYNMAKLLASIIFITAIGTLLVWSAEWIERIFRWESSTDEPRTVR